MTLPRQTMFTMGEVDLSMWKRTDVEAYLNAAQSLKNMLVGTTGLARKRPGSKRLLDTGLAGLTDPNGQIYEFMDNDNNHYLIISANLKMSVYQYTGTALTFITTLVTPYVSADLRDLDYDSDTNVLIFTHQKYPQARIYKESGTFYYAPLVIKKPPVFDFNKVDYNNASVTFTSTATTFTMVISALFTTDWINGQVISAGKSVEAPIGNGYITNVQPNVPAPGQTTITGDVGVQFAPNADMPTIGSQYSIRQPLWTPTLGYPACVVFYQSRLWFAATPTQQSALYGSWINDFVNFDVGTGLDNQAIIYTLGESGAGRVLWMNGGKQLEVFTETDEFAAPQDQAVGLTPSTFSIRQQSAYGTIDHCKPITYLNDTYFIGKSGHSIYNYHFNGVGLTYQSSNVSLHAQHLVKVPINRALKRGGLSNQDNILFYLNNDNTVTAFQFSLEFKLAALTPVVFQENVSVLDICQVNNEIFLYKHYPLTNTYTIEVFDNDYRIDSYNDYTMDNVGNISGLDIFNGYKVQVVFNGQDFGQYNVTGGQITVYNPLFLSGTAQVGLLYENEIVPMYFYEGNAKANYYKYVNRIFVDYQDSLNFYINNELVSYQNFQNIQNNLPLIPQTDTAAISIISGYNRYNTFKIYQNSPFDLNVTGISYQVKATYI